MVGEQGGEAVERGGVPGRPGECVHDAGHSVLHTLANDRRVCGRHSVRRTDTLLHREYMVRRTAAPHSSLILTTDARQFSCRRRRCELGIRHVEAPALQRQEGDERSGVGIWEWGSSGDLGTKFPTGVQRQCLDRRNGDEVPQKMMLLCKLYHN